MRYVFLCRSFTTTWRNLSIINTETVYNVSILRAAAIEMRMNNILNWNVMFSIIWLLEKTWTWLHVIKKKADFVIRFTNNIKPRNFDKNSQQCHNLISWIPL